MSKEHPILFSGPMVHAILSGQKTQTRRVMKPQPNAGPNGKMVHLGGNGWGLLDGILSGEWMCPYGQPGDRLWVREMWQYYDWNGQGEPFIRYAADGEIRHRNVPAELSSKLIDKWAEPSDPENYKLQLRACDQKWRSAIHMPRWASRIMLEVVSVRLERLKDISDHDALHEGIAEAVPGLDVSIDNDWWPGRPRIAFAKLWDSINAKRGFPASSNPWVWALTFKPVTGEAE